MIRLTRVVDDDRQYVHCAQDHTATLLANGQVLVAGGIDTGHLTFRCAELYDPASGSWMATANLNPPRYNHTATLLRNGRVLVCRRLRERRPPCERRTTTDRPRSARH